MWLIILDWTCILTHINTDHVIKLNLRSLRTISKEKTLWYCTSKTWAQHINRTPSNLLQMFKIIDAIKTIKQLWQLYAKIKNRSINIHCPYSAIFTDNYNNLSTKHLVITEYNHKQSSFFLATLQKFNSNWIPLVMTFSSAVNVEFYVWFFSKENSNS